MLGRCLGSCRYRVLTDSVEIYHDKLGASRGELGIKLGGGSNFLDHPVGASDTGDTKQG